MVIAFLALLAAAQQDDEETSEEDGATIVVYGEHRAEQARKEVAKNLIDQGYDTVIREDGYTVYRHFNAWKGEVRLYDDGWIRHRRQPLQLGPKPGRSWVSCLFPVNCIRAGGLTVSRTKHMQQRRRALYEVEPLARVWGDRVADLHVDETLRDLPDRLDALWADGVPLVDGDPPIPTPEGRRAALLAYWDSRTDTLWGHRVRAAVEAFVQAEVQTGPFPYTDAEIAAFNARRSSARPFDVDRPWDQVLADLEMRSE